MKNLSKIMWLTCAVAVGVILGSSRLHAQLDPAAHRQLWPIESAYAEAIVSGDIEKLAEFWHEGYLEWPADESLPWDKFYALKTSGKRYGFADGKLSTPMMEPLQASITEDFGVTHTRLEYTIENKNGQKSQRTILVTHFWVITNDGWKLFGGSSTED